MYIFWGMYAVGFCFTLYSKLNVPRQDTVYKDILSFVYLAGITIYLIFNLKSKEFVIFEDYILFSGQKIFFSEIGKIEAEEDKILVFNRNSQKLIDLHATQFQAEVWKRLSEKMINIKTTTYNLL